MKRYIMVILGILALGVPSARAQSTEALLDTIQYSAFRFFWDEANPSNGLIPDRSAFGSPCSIASTGFGLSAICVGIDHGWIDRSAGADRVRTTLQTFWTYPQGPEENGRIGYQGFFYHFLDMNTGLRTWASELSSIDSALLLAGILDAQQYFDQDDPVEDEIRTLADSIYERMNWEFMRNFNPGLMMGWKPSGGFSGFGQWIGYNEAMIMYILALGSPTHPIPASAWNQWTSGYVWSNQYGYDYVIFPPLFGHQYSHCWIDFRGLQDDYMQVKGIDYFENSRRATLAQQAYCVANPLSFVGYSDSLWGITASDGPFGYAARGAPPFQNDDGTIAPTAAAGSVPFAPEASIPVLRNLWNNYRAMMWGPYGFIDAFNLTVQPDWYDTDYIGIDQGPIVLMIENYRTESIWTRFMQNQDILVGLDRAGFVGLPVAVGTGVERPSGLELSVGHPNPLRHEGTIRFALAASGHVRLAVFDVSGREVARLIDASRPAGQHEVTLRGDGLIAGVYFIRLESNGVVENARFVRLD